VETELNSRSALDCVKKMKFPPPSYSLISKDILKQDTKCFSQNIVRLVRVSFKENVMYPVWICWDPISLILRTRFFLILGTR